jgi:hypothetical protein
MIPSIAKSLNATMNVIKLDIIESSISISEGTSRKSTWQKTEKFRLIDHHQCVRVLVVGAFLWGFSRCDCLCLFFVCFPALFGVVSLFQWFGSYGYVCASNDMTLIG